MQSVDIRDQVWKKARRTLVDSRNSGLCLAAYIKRSGLVTPEQMKEIEEKIAYTI